MGNMCLIENDTVVNVIYVDPMNAELFSEAGMELTESASIGLEIGDYREGETWYRNMEGEKTQLPIHPTAEDYEAYYNAMTAEIEGGEAE